MESVDIEKCLIELMWEAQNQKTLVDAPSVARRWAVFYTELEKILAYYQSLLKSKESE